MEHKLDKSLALKILTCIDTTLKHAARFMRIFWLFDIKHLPLMKQLYLLLRWLNPLPDPLASASNRNSAELNLTPYEDLKNFYEAYIAATNKVFNKDNQFTHLEFGVFNGNSLASACNAIKALGIEDAKVMAFDSFQGLPKESEYEDHFYWKEGMYSCDRKQTISHLESMDVNEMGRINFVEGWFKDTLSSQMKAELNLTRFDVAFVDCDTYSSASLVLSFLAPLIKDSSLICFDDWKLKNLDIQFGGEAKAFKEFLILNPDIEFKEVKSYCRKAKCFIVCRQTS